MYKKRRVVKKKPSYAMVPRPLLNREKAHRHVLTCSTSTQEIFYILNNAGGVSDFVTAAQTGANLSLTFSLSEVVLRISGLTAITLAPSNFAELVALYDTFQIEKVDISLWSSTSQANAATGVLPFVMPLIGHCPDTDDANNTSLTSLQQYSQYKCEQLGQGRPLKVSVVPCAQGTVTSGRSRLQKQDINTGFPATPHYGYKMACDSFKAVDSNVVTLLSMQFRIHYLMKTTR